MTKDPMQNMAATLLNPGWPALRARTPALHEAVPGSPMTKTDRLRAYLRDVGPATPVMLAQAADLNTTALVGALLKSDVRRGQVRLHAGKYFWAHDFDAAREAEIREAAALLRRAGWRVKRP